MTFTFIVAFTLVGLGVIILVVEVKHPDADTALLVNTMMSLVSGILGALLGLIAGKSKRTADQRRPRPAPGRDDRIEP